MGADAKSSNNDILSADAIADDKRMKRALLIDTFAKNCSSSPNEILQEINRVINEPGNGCKLEATVLSGGYTNFSYKVFVDAQPELCVFAKLCFEYALWNPDKSAHYDLQRTDNEYEIMKSVSSKTPGSVVTPLALWDVENGGQRMKLLVTEWSTADEQLGNQFIDGSVDPRIAPKIADTLATLHGIEGFDPEFNVLVKPCMENLLEQMKSVAISASNASSPKDRTEAYCAGLGEGVVRSIIYANIANYHQRDCLIHSDAHVFNLLVEAKPSIEKLEEFGPNGNMVLCDWEMAMAGPIGRDVGLVLSFPMACMVAHAISGHSEANESIDAFVDALMDTYCSRMARAGKSPEEVASILRNIAGWCGWFQYLAFYVLNVQDNVPVDSDENRARVRDAMGVLGLKLMRLSYGAEHVTALTGLDDIRRSIRSLLEEEVALARRSYESAKRRRMLPRKSSVLRASNRRLSDTEMLYRAAESVRMLSIGDDVEKAGSSSAVEGTASELMQ